MNIVSVDQARFCFADAANSPSSVRDKTVFHSYCQDVLTTYSLNSLSIPNETHSNIGSIIDEDPMNKVSIYEKQGDYLITTSSHTAIAVITADCLPVFIYDNVNSVIAIIHSGWKGSFDNIAVNALNTMRNQYGTDPANVKVYYGPNAKICCYEVQKDFIEKLLPLCSRDEYPSLIEEREGKFYFNNGNFVTMQLIKNGVLPHHIDDSYNECTICNTSYNSFRRQRNSPQRSNNVSIAWLEK